MGLDLPEIRLVDLIDQTEEEVTYKEMAGTYDVRRGASAWEGDPLDFGTLTQVTFPAVAEFPRLTIHGVWPFLIAYRNYIEIELDESTIVSCDIIVTYNGGLVGGGEIIEGDALQGTLLCDGDPLGVRWLLSYEIVECCVDIP